MTATDSPPLARGRISTPTSHRPRRNHRQRREALAGYMFLLPWFIGLGVLVIGPMVMSAALSFTDYDLFTTATWVGLDNYQVIFTEDADFRQSLTVTTLYVVFSVPLRLAVALGLAVLMNRAMRGAGPYRAVLYLPSLVGGSVAVALMWRQLFGRDGAVNWFLGLVGIDGPNWIASPDTALSTLVLLGVWQFGSPMIIFLAGLKTIPAELGEAAMVDGASAARRFFAITLPLLTPIVFFNLVMQTIVAFQSFTSAFIVSNGTGGPVGSTLFYTLYLYQRAFTEFDMGYASALAWILVVIIGIVTAINFVGSRRWVFYSDEGR